MSRPNPLNRPNSLPTGERRRLSSHQQAALEYRAASKQRDIYKLISENQRLAAAYVALRDDNSLADEDHRRLSAVAVKVKSDRNSEIREFYESSLKMEFEVRAINSMDEQLEKVRADVAKLSLSEKELSTQLQAIDEDVLAARAESNEVPTVKAEIEALRKEILKGRVAIEHEKKTRESNLEHGKIMEQHMISMAREMDKLRAELAKCREGSKGCSHWKFKYEIPRKPLYVTHQGPVDCVCPPQCISLVECPQDTRRCQKHIHIDEPLLWCQNLRTTKLMISVDGESL